MTLPSRFRPVLTPDRLAAGLLALIPFIYFYSATFGDLVLSPDDGLLFNVPLRTAAAQILINGSLPLWNPYIFSGMPLLGSTQGGLLFPLNWWFLVFSPATAANLMVLSSYSIAGLGAYLYARKTGATIAGSVLTGVIWQLGGHLVGQISHINIVQTAAMLPWVLWTIENFASTGKRRSGVAVVVAVCLQIFVGHPQAMVYALLLVSAYTMVMSVTHTSLRRRYLVSMLLVSVGPLLAAVQILPTLELLSNSIRSDTSYEFFSSFSLPRQSLLMLISPYILGGGDGRLFRVPYSGSPYYAEFIPYVSIVALLLSIIALVIRRDSRSVFWAIIAVIAFVLALGDNAPLAINQIIYHIPLLNLFRVPARHLMEVDFALAVLAGRGLTVLGTIELTKRARLGIAATCLGGLVITFLVVTFARPANFQLGRDAPISLLRAPELFLPIVVALISGVAVWYFARRRSTYVAAGVIFVALLDLALWGQFSGYMFSPRRSNELWHTPESVKTLRELTGGDFTSYRILTAPHPFDPGLAPVPPSVSHSPEWSLWTQPDPYMMHAVRNAGGYDGFGLQRYGKLAGDMKVWGELTDPNTTLRGPSREIDILNVRYLISMRSKTGAELSQLEKGTEQYGSALFSPRDIGLPNVQSQTGLNFKIEPISVDQVAIVTNLSWSQDLPDGTVVARLRLSSVDGQSFEFPIKAGTDTSEWAHDRADINAVIKHKRAPVATSYPVADAKGSYEGHTYVTKFTLPREVKVASGEILLEPNAAAPQLTMTLLRISLGKGADFYALGRESFASGPSKSTAGEPGNRWKRVGQTESVEVYENSRTLPLAWLVTESQALTERQTLFTIRSGQHIDGSDWEPRRTALVEPDGPVIREAAGEQEVQVARYEPNRIEVDVSTATQGILVLSENHYPGWRAYVDGASVDVMRVNYNLRGVMVGSGQHRVEFRYIPKSFYIGLAVSLGTAIFLAAWWAGVPKLKHVN